MFTFFAIYDKRIYKLMNGYIQFIMLYWTDSVII